MEPFLPSKMAQDKMPVSRLYKREMIVRRNFSHIESMVADKPSCMDNKIRVFLMVFSRKLNKKERRFAF